jgi:hypothetical protein
MAFQAVLDGLQQQPYKAAAAAPALEALAQQVEGEQGTRMLVAFLVTLQQKPNDEVQPIIDRLVQGLVSKIPPSTRERMAMELRKQLAETGSDQASSAMIIQICDVLRTRPESEHVGELFELLKYPVLAGPPTNQLLASLTRFKLPETISLKEATRFVEKNFPTIDLDAPPHPPHLPSDAVRASCQSNC